MMDYRFAISMSQDCLSLPVFLSNRIYYGLPDDIKMPARKYYPKQNNYEEEGNL
jgi:hypothetical protein